MLRVRKRFEKDDITLLPFEVLALKRQFIDALRFLRSGFFQKKFQLLLGAVVPRERYHNLRLKREHDLLGVGRRQKLFVAHRSEEDVDLADAFEDLRRKLRRRKRAQKAQSNTLELDGVNSVQ